MRQNEIIIMSDRRIISCDFCEGSGRHYQSYRAWDGAWDDRDIGPRGYCNGTGEEEVDVEPIEPEDLETTEPAGNVISYIMENGAL